ncbi:MAG: hypothetical protein F4X65_13765 [Chloroflexi bacterium]|nr:hypothetical protein [Chloroflexota bacterium]
MNIIVALGAAVLCMGIIGVTLLLVQERGDVARVTEELGQRDSELAQARSQLQQALNQPDPRLAALEQARQQLEGQNRQLSSHVQTLESERDELNSRVLALEQGRISLRTFLAGVDRRASSSAESAPASGDVSQEPSPGVGVPPDLSPDLSPELSREQAQDSPPGLDPAMAAENQSLKAQVSRLESEVSRLQEENRAAGTATGNTAAGSTATGSTAGGDTAALEARESELRALIASLEQQEAGLRAVIATLEDDRKALAVQANEMFPVCSGSMEPKITCLDTVVLLENFLPQDIEVGTVISFIPPPEEGEETAGAAPVLHRVADIKQEDGIYHYWPKGDAWAEPDGYWVPETSVVGYVIELMPGTRPENSALRDLVNRTRKTYADARDNMVAARSSYDEAAIANCGSVEAVASCQATEEGFSQVSGAYTQFTQAWNAYVSAVCEYDRAYFHGLHESEPKENQGVTPYTAPAQCNG